MKFSPSLGLALLAATAAAQSTGSTACAAANIVEACLGTTTAYLGNCSSQDWQCLCDAYVAINTCFNNCPNDARSPSYQQQRQLYCMNASIYGAATKTTPAGGATPTAVVSSVATATTTTAGAADAASGTTTAAGATRTNAAAGGVNAAVVCRDGGMLAVVAVVAALL